VLIPSDKMTAWSDPIKSFASPHLWTLSLIC
jgi:hypothetical protein